MELNTLYLALGAAFIAVFGFVYSVGGLLGRGRGVRERLHEVAGRTALEGAPEASKWRRRVARAARPMAKLAAPKEEEEIGRVRARFMNAGFREESAPIIYFGAKTLLAIALPLLLVFFSDLREWKGNLPLVGLLGSAAFGYYLPNVILARLTERRQRELFESFPDALDLLIVCVESGLSLDAAIARTAAEIHVRSRHLAEELSLVGMELRLGATRERALRNLATRTGLDEIASFVAMMLQADRFGTSIGDSMRVQADSLRVRRRQRAEEMAAKIPLKMLFPLIFCIFPSLLLVLMGPAMIQIYRTLLPTMGGGG